MRLNIESNRRVCHDRSVCYCDQNKLYYHLSLAHMNSGIFRTNDISYRGRAGEVNYESHCC